MADDRVKREVVTALRNASPDPLSPETIAGVVRDELQVSDAKVRDAVDELYAEGQIERLEEDGTVRYREN